MKGEKRKGGRGRVKEEIHFEIQLHRWQDICVERGGGAII